MKSVGDSCAPKSPLPLKKAQLQAAALRGFLAVFQQIQGGASMAEGRQHGPKAAQWREGAWHPTVLSAVSGLCPGLPQTEWALKGPHTRVVNWSTQALRILSGVAGLSSRKSSVLRSGFLARAARMASLMAKKIEADRKRGGSPTAWANRAQDRESGNETPAFTPGGLVTSGTPADTSRLHPVSQREWSKFFRGRELST